MFRDPELAPERCNPETQRRLEARREATTQEWTSLEDRGQQLEVCIFPHMGWGAGAWFLPHTTFSMF